VHAAFIVIVALIASLSHGATARQTPGPERVLFIGNSLTAANDLPAMIEAIAADGDTPRRVTVRAVALPDFGLEEHWNDGRALAAIESERWTTIVLQQGPSSLESSQQTLRTFAKKFADAIRPTKARIVLYGVWPPRARLAFQDAVTTSYARAATDVGGTLVPVGEAWRAAWHTDPALPLYASDDFHPSPLGSYVAALMFVQRLTGKSPIGMPPPSRSPHAALRAVVVNDVQLRTVQRAAADANARAASFGRQAPARQ
jgi:hypothetical protein